MFKQTDYYRFLPGSEWRSVWKRVMFQICKHKQLECDDNCAKFVNNATILIKEGTGLDFSNTTNIRKVEDFSTLIN